MDITKKFENRQVIEGLTLGGLHNEARWCAWQTELRERGPKVVPAKLGYGIDNRWARSNKSDRWMTWTQAMNLLARGLNPELRAGPSGIGVFTGALDGGNEGLTLCGLDLDACLDGEGVLKGWAAAVLECLGVCYSEVSPSGTGVKAFLLVRDEDLEAVRGWWRIGTGSYGRKFSPKVLKGAVREREDGEVVIGGHGEGIEFYHRFRWFAVTGDAEAICQTPLGLMTPEVARAVVDTVERHGFNLKQRWDGGRGAEGEHLSEDEMKALDDALGAADLALWERLSADTDGVIGRELRDLDTLSKPDRSRIANHIAAELRGMGVPRDTVFKLLRYDGMGGWFEEKARAYGGQQLMRLWNSVAHRDVVKRAAAIGLGKVELGSDLPEEEENEPKSAGAAASAKADFIADPTGALQVISEAAIAEWLVHDNFHNLRYVGEQKQWLQWEGRRWESIGETAARAIALKACNKVAVAATTHRKLVPTLRSARTMIAVETIARTQPEIKATPKQWDCDPWALNTPEGILDLRNGILKPSDRLAFMTKITPVGPDWNDDACPKWLKFLSEITKADKDLEAFLGRVAGSCLTGCTHDESIFFLYGNGGNGKGTFVETLSYVLGEDYAVAAAMGMFMAGKDRHSTEIADLKGMRLVTTSETAKNAEWDEGKVNALTGGGKVNARKMRMDSERWMPEYKLMMSGNHKPRMGGSVTNADRRRLKLIMFLASFSGKENFKLKAELKSEASGILAWMVRGCLAWKDIGLSPPTSVLSATESYLNAEDSRMTWFEEGWQRGPGETEEGALFESWGAWAIRVNEDRGSVRALSEWLEQQGFTFGKNVVRRKVWRGVVQRKKANTQDSNPSSHVKPE